MRGTTQSQWLHCIPKRAAGAPGTVGGRMNLTFRRVVNPAGECVSCFVSPFGFMLEWFG
jgi:hypothetical protein